MLGFGKVCLRRSYRRSDDAGRRTHLSSQMDVVRRFRERHIVLVDVVFLNA